MRGNGVVIYMHDYIVYITLVYPWIIKTHVFLLSMVYIETNKLRYSHCA